MEVRVVVGREGEGRMSCRGDDGLYFCNLRIVYVWVDTFYVVFV